MPAIGDIRIGERVVGPGHPAWIVAEMSANHGQSLDRAMDILRAAAQAGANAVKVQTYTPDTMTLDCNRPEFRIGKGTLWEGRYLHELYGEAYTPWEWQPRLKEAAEKLGLQFFSTPFDATAVEFLEDMHVCAHKIASFELVDIPLIRRVAQTGKPIIMSTGMATLEEIGEAVEAARQAGAREVALLKCTSAYPARLSEMHLRALPELSERFGVPVGLSDHTMGFAGPVVAVALGACIIEKHFTLARADGGPDSAFSLEPEEFRQMVSAVREAEEALGAASFDITPGEEASRVFRRSLFAVRDIAAGELLTEENVRSIRPGYGLAPKHWDTIVGRRAKVKIDRGTPLAWSLLD